MGRLIGSVGLSPGSDSGFDLDTKGQIHGYSTTQYALPVGSNDQIVYADSSATGGLSYGASAKSTLTTTGDLLVASGANTLSRIGAGTSGDVLTSTGAGSVPTYQTPGGGGAWTLIDEITNGDASDLTFGSVGGSDLSGFNWCRVLLTTTSTGSGDYGNINFFNNTTTVNSGYYSQGMFGSRVVAIAYTTENSIAWFPLFFSDGTPASCVGLDMMFSVVSNGLGSNNHIAYQKSNSNGGNGNSCEINDSTCTFTSASSIAGFQFVAGASGNALTPQAGTVNMSIFGS